MIQYDIYYAMKLCDMRHYYLMRFISILSGSICYDELHYVTLCYLTFVTLCCVMLCDIMLCCSLCDVSMYLETVCLVAYFVI